MIMINRDFCHDDDVNVLHLSIKEMSIIWSALEFLTSVQDPEDRPESEKDELKRKLVPFFELKDKVKGHLELCTKGGISDEDIH